MKFVLFILLYLSCKKDTSDFAIYEQLTPISRIFVNKIIAKDVSWISKRFSDDKSVQFSGGGGHFSMIRSDLTVGSNLYNILFKVSKDEEVFRDSVSFHTALINAQSVKECTNQCISTDLPDIISRIVTVKFNEYVYKISIICLPGILDPETCILDSLEIDVAP
ncbi:hypothetical protein EHQ16_01050 [Leptospira kanakyensis]|uniref:Uncharacterized protein n=1 Tax=Leptospira kanakyensis TaxID=2484968 RepID=A0A6N4Q843_9LEPT|nr:hypothetical protein [Leptospira kanakyensis]TGK63086.1 hypothetical protein EHQ16_01050 [Leptospira kanakyensis]TGK66692.1 hypothetical protein EHQ18_16285 [Leptospira kanakyensis]